MLSDLYPAIARAAADARLLSDIYPDAPQIDESHPELDDTIAHVATLLHMAHTPGRIIDRSARDGNGLSVEQEPDSYDWDCPHFVIARMPENFAEDEMPAERDYFHQYVKAAGAEVEISLTVLVRRGHMLVLEVEVEAW